MTGGYAADERVATRGSWLLPLLQLGALVSVVAASPYVLFDLDQHSVPKELVLHAVAWTAAVVLLVRASRLVFSLLDLLLLAGLGLGLLSSLAATNHWLAFRALGLSAAGLVLFWAAAEVKRRGKSRALLSALAVAAVLASVTALLQAYGVESALWGRSRAPGGTFGNRNFVAHYAALGLPLLLLLALRAVGRGGRWIALIGGALTMAALVLSRSRAGWLGTGAGAAAILAYAVLAGLHRDTELRRRARDFTIALAVGLLAALVLPNRLDWRSDSPYLDTLAGVTNYKEGSGRGRLIQYRNSVRLLEDDPLLGVGPGNWPVAYPRVTSAGDPAYEAGAVMPTNPWPSSDWVALLVERGGPAFVVLLTAGGLILVRAGRRLFGTTTRDEALEALTLTGFVVVLAVVGMFDAVLLLPAPTYLIWAALGALVPDGRPQLIVTPTPRQRRGLTAAAAIVGVLLLARGGFQLAAMTVYSSGRDTATIERAARLDPGSYRIQMGAAAIEIGRKRCDLARPHAERARALFPTLPAPVRYLRACGVRLPEPKVGG